MEKDWYYFNLTKFFSKSSQYFYISSIKYNLKKRKIFLLNVIDDILLQF